jgi:hypothetical protein
MNKKLYKLHESYKKHDYKPINCSYQGLPIYYCTCGAFTEGRNTDLKSADPDYYNKSRETVLDTARETLSVLDAVWAPLYRDFMRYVYYARKVELKPDQAPQDQQKTHRHLVKLAKQLGITLLAGPPET